MFSIGALKEAVERLPLGFVAGFRVVFRFVVIWFQFSLFVDLPFPGGEDVHNLLTNL